MRKFGRFISIAAAMTMVVGMLAGCGADKTMAVTYDYNAAEYVQIGEYKGIEVELEDYTVTDEDLQDVIDQLLNRYINYNLVDRPAKEGDKVILSFDAYISGGRVEGFSGEDYEAVIGSNEFLVEGFEDALVGVTAGESKAITGLKVPADFSTVEKYAGRAITFDIEVTGVYESSIPTYADDFVTAVTKGEFTTVDAYNQELVRMLEENAVTNKYNEKYNEILDKLMTDAVVLKDFPAEYIESKKAGIQEEVDKYIPIYNITEEEYMMKYYGVASVEEAAKNQIKLEFIFQQIIEAEKLTVTQKYYEENLKDTAAERGFSTTEKFVESVTENGAVKCMLLDKAEDILIESAVEK